MPFLLMIAGCPVSYHINDFCLHPHIWCVYFFCIKMEEEKWSFLGCRKRDFLLSTIHLFLRN